MTALSATAGSREPGAAKYAARPGWPPSQLMIAESMARSIRSALAWCANSMPSRAMRVAQPARSAPAQTRPEAVINNRPGRMRMPSTPPLLVAVCRARAQTSTRLRGAPGTTGSGAGPGAVPSASRDTISDGGWSGAGNAEARPAGGHAPHLA
jgi:hypothetical protein